MDPLSTCLLFEQFLAERRYLKNVTPSTLEWYETAFKALQKALGADVPPLTKSSLQQFVVSIRQRASRDRPRLRSDRRYSRHDADPAFAARVLT